jgi:hypothetical protein
VHWKSGANAAGRWGTERRERLARSEEAQMKVGSSLVMMGAAFFATAAIAADTPPKEGAFTGKLTVNGELLKTTPVGKNGDALNIFEENGTAANGDKVHCLWLAPVIKNTAIEPHGYCLTTDKDGDQTLARMTSGTRPFSVPTGYAVGEAMMGTGKYAGVTSASVSTCQFSGSANDPTHYSVTCDVQGSYKAP